jgi:hypothetical protein
VRDVAWRNPDGAEALIAYDTTGGTRNVRVNWGLLRPARQGLGNLQLFNW